MKRIATLAIFGTLTVVVAPLLAQSKAEVEPDSQASTSRTADETAPSAGGQAKSKKAKRKQRGAQPQRSADASNFLRLRLEAEQPVSLDTAVVTYKSRGTDNFRVDLIGAVHVGEAAYYEQLNALFDDYDVLLYELVAEEGTVIPRGGKRDSGFNPLAMLQDGTKNMLGLESQLECIDYSKQHFVRADLTPKQIAAKMAERGDSALTIALDTFADALRQQKLAAENAQANPLLSVEDISLADMLGNPLKMKRVMASQFAMTGSLDQTLGDSLKQLLIVDRNAQALKVLREQQALGHQKIGIFYGAAHLPDFDKHLVADLGLKRQDTKWISAWDLTEAKKPELSEPANLFLNLLKALEP